MELLVDDTRPYGGLNKIEVDLVCLVLSMVRPR